MAIYRAACDEDDDGVVQALSSRFSLPSTVVDRIMNDQNGDALAVLLKSDETPAAEAHRLQILLFDAIGSSTNNAIRAMRVYETLTVAECRKSVCAWGGRGTDTAPISAPAPNERRDSHAEAMSNRHGSVANADRPAQVEIEHRRYAF